MKISKKDALLWFDFLSQLSDEDEITSVHEEITASTKFACAITAITVFIYLTYKWYK